MDCGMRCYGKKVGFVVDYVVICVCSVASCNPCYLILYYLKVVKVCGGYDWCPCGAGIFKDGSCDGLVGVDECVFMFTPGCTSECFVYFYCLVCFGFCILYMFGKGEFWVEGEA